VTTTDAVSVVPEEVSGCFAVGVQIDFHVKWISTTTMTVQPQTRKLWQQFNNQNHSTR